MIKKVAPDVDTLTQDDVDLILSEDPSWRIGSVWCAYADLPIKEDSYFDDLLYHFHLGVANLWTEHYDQPRPLQTAMDVYCSSLTTGVLLAPGIDVSTPVYEFSYLREEFPVGRVNVPGVTFVGLVYFHAHEADEMAKARSILEEKMKAIEIVRDS